MIRMVTAVEVTIGQEDAWKQAWWTLREARSQYPGLRGVSLLRDSTQPTQYLVLSQREGTQRGELFGADPIGKRLRFTRIDIVCIEGGQLVEHWEQADVLGALSELRFLPA